MKKETKSEYFRIGNGSITSLDEIKSELRKFVLAGVLIQVEKNGEVAYQNSPKFEKLSDEEKEELLDKLV